MRTKMPEGTFNGPEKGRRERTDQTGERGKKAIIDTLRI